MKIFITGAFFLLTIVPVFAQNTAEIGVISTYLRKSPDYAAEKLQTLQKGDKIVIDKSREAGGWYYVTIADGAQKGWIRREAVTVTNSPETVKIAARENESNRPQTPNPIVKPQSAPQNRKISEPIKNLPTDAEKSAATETKTIADPPPGEAASDDENEVLRIDTAEVSLYVRVLARNNRPVKDLKQTDFKVFEDGVPQPVTSLTVAEVPILNALVIDNSRSLRPQLAKIIEAGKILVASNRDKDESTVVRFVDSEKIEVIRDFTSDKAALNNALENLFVEGGQTAIIDAVYQTAERVEKYQNTEKKDDNKLRAVILISDGDDRGSKHTEQQLFDLLRRSNVQVYAVGFTDAANKLPDAAARREKSKNFMARLATETGGKVYFPASTEELSPIAADISGELRTQYMLSYAPTGETVKSDSRKIKVEIADGAGGEKRNAVTRMSREVAPK